MNAAPFLGDWLVSEYLYTPAGEYVGLVRQRRQLKYHGQTIRVTQWCQPVEEAQGISADAQATVQVLNQRVGEFVFDLQMDDRARRYLGPDVTGGGFSWREGVLTARGLWPRFGCNFTSFSLMLHPERQVTGGKFFWANQEIATIVGVAAPESAGYPAFFTQTGQGSYIGEGTWVGPDGEIHEIVPLQGVSPMADLQQTAAGLQKTYGPLIEMEAVIAPGEMISAIEITDHASGMLTGLWKHIRDEKLNRVFHYILRKQP